MANLLKEMEKQVNGFVKNFQTDFTVHDTNRLLKEAKPNEHYYWLIRENGTQLHNEKDLIVSSEDWNERDLLYYFKDYKCKLFILAIDSNKENVIEGKLKEVSFNKAWNDLQKSLKTPSKLKIKYKDDILEYPWEEVGSPSHFLDVLSAYFKQPIDWNKIEYNFVF